MLSFPGIEVFKKQSGSDCVGLPPLSFNEGRKGHQRDLITSGPFSSTDVFLSFSG